MAKLIFHTYAEALYEVGLEKDSLEEYAKDMKLIIDSFNEYPDFFELFITPRIEHKKRKEVMEEVFGKKITREVLSFTKILIDKDRGVHIRGIYDSFIHMVDEHLGVVKAIIESAIELTDDEKDRLKKNLEEMTNKTIRMTCIVNPKVIGGLIIKVEDNIIDASIRNRLDEMKQSLAQLIV